MKKLLCSLIILCSVSLFVSCEKESNFKPNESEKTLNSASPRQAKNYLTGSGEINRVARWTGPYTLGTGIIYDNGSTAYIGTSGLALTTPATLTIENSLDGVSMEQLRLVNRGVNNSGSYISFFNDPNESARLAVSVSGAFTFSSGSAVNQRMIITSGGNVGIGVNYPTHRLDVAGEVCATGFIQSSDRNLKQNIQNLDNSLEKILSLRGVSFNWKDNDVASIGLIAQEVEKVYPELVSSKNDKYGVQYANLVAPLIEAIKSQQAIINCQQAQITSLQEQNKIFDERLKKLEQQPVAKR
ncbi:MAG: tail fiber domain-containing protein [Candidatus Falkowbacteria bacterium]